MGRGLQITPIYPAQLSSRRFRLLWLRVCTGAMFWQPSSVLCVYLNIFYTVTALTLPRYMPVNLMPSRFEDFRRLKTFMKKSAFFKSEKLMDVFGLIRAVLGLIRPRPQRSLTDSKTRILVRVAPIVTNMPRVVFWIGFPIYTPKKELSCNYIFMVTFHFSAVQVLNFSAQSSLFRRLSGVVNVTVFQLHSPRPQLKLTEENS